MTTLIICSNGSTCKDTPVDVRLLAIDKNILVTGSNLDIDKPDYQQTYTLEAHTQLSELTFLKKLGSSLT